MSNMLYMIFLKSSLRNIVLFIAVQLSWASSCLADTPFNAELIVVAQVKKVGNTQIIHLPKGTFQISSTVRLPSNSILEGDGSDTVLVVSPNFLGEQFITNDDHIGGNRNITIRSLQIRFDLPKLKGNSPGILRLENVDTVTIRDLVMSIRSPLYAIDLASYCRNVLIENCDITNYGGGGSVVIRNRDTRAGHVSSNISVQKNVFRSQSGDETISIFGWLGILNNVTAKNNNVVAGSASFGIAAYNGNNIQHSGTLSNAIISDNTVVGSRVGGIGILGGAKSVAVVRNTIRNTAGDGIFLHKGGEQLPEVVDISLKDNTLEHIGRHGIFATGRNIIIDNNRINDCKQSGIYIGNDVTVTHNLITNSSPGILVDGYRNRKVQYNKLIGSDIRVLNSDWKGIDNNTIERSLK